MPDPPTLEYAPPQRWLRRRWRRLALLSLLLLIAIAAWWWRRDIEFAWNRAALLRAQQRCLDYQPDAGRIAYEEDLTKVNELLARDRDYVPVNIGSDDDPRTIALWSPQHIRQFPDSLSSPYGLRNTHYKGPGALLFLHERTTPNGRRVLVCAEAFIRRDQPTPDIGINVTVFEPGTWKTPPKPLGGHLGVLVYIGQPEPSRPLCVFAGRPDPADASRFTAEYEVMGKRGVIEGRITDNADPQGWPVVTSFEELWETVHAGARR